LWKHRQRRACESQEQGKRVGLDFFHIVLPVEELWNCPET
jgi:hypothetical protein